MSEKGLTNISLKKINKSKVYQYIYRKKTTSKLQIVEKHYICITMEKKEMQHKDIVAELARRLERGEADVEALADGFASLLKEHCGALETVAVPGFGKFEGEKLMERVEVDSASGRRMLYPPEIRMTFVPGTRLKTRIAEKGEAGDE